MDSSGPGSPRWRAVDPRAYGSQPAPSIDFLGDNDPNTGDPFEPDDITDGAITRVFRITNAKVIAQELNKNKVIRMLECPNPHIIEVTVAPAPAP